MADHGVIGDVSATLAALLTRALAPLTPPPGPVARTHDLLGTIATDEPMLTLFLYEVAEDASAKNRPPIRRDTPPDVTVTRPPMALILRYLVTPWSNDRLTDQQMLARAMQAFYDNAIIGGPLLQAGLIGSTDSLKVTLSPLDLEERARIWHAVQKPYRVSLSYEVRVVNLDSEVERRVKPVTQRVLEGAMPGSAP